MHATHSWRFIDAACCASSAEGELAIQTRSAPLQDGKKGSIECNTSVARKILSIQTILSNGTDQAS